MKPLIVAKTQALIYVSLWTDYRKIPGQSVQRAKQIKQANLKCIQEIQICPEKFYGKGLIRAKSFLFFQ